MSFTRSNVGLEIDVTNCSRHGQYACNMVIVRALKSSFYQPWTLHLPQ